jgi:hypothetical protein
MNGFVIEGLIGRSALRKTLQKHFGGISIGDIVTAAREFPITSRIDVQKALEQILAEHPGVKLLGVHSQLGHETPDRGDGLRRWSLEPEVAWRLEHARRRSRDPGTV